VSDLTDFFGEPIAVYTTTDALRDGVLVDAGPQAPGYLGCTVLLTAAAWQDCVAWTDEDSQRTTAWAQSQSGRLHDVLWMAECGLACRRLPQSFQLYRVARDAQPGPDHEVEADLVTLKGAVGYHDDGTSLLVISLPEED
jgi:hypothetical protein